MDISVIMPSYLGDYIGCASNQKIKFHRAVQSFINQSIGKNNTELIIVSDGCKETNLLYDKFYRQETNIILHKISKQDMFSGTTRQEGINIARGKYICFLDTDDIILPYHLETILNQFEQSDWCYWDDYLMIDSNGRYIVRPTVLEKGKCGTSTIAYRKNLDTTWYGKDNYGHDYELIKELQKKSKKNVKIFNTGYVCCHVPKHIDL